MSGPSSDAVERTAHKAGSALGWGVLLKGLRVIFAVASSILIRRVLGPELAGEYDVVRTFLEIAAGVASIGTGQIILRFLPEARLGHRRRVVRRLMGWSIGLQIVGWLVCLGLIVYMRPVIVGWFDRETLSGLLLVGMALLITRLLFDFSTQVYHALLDLRLVSLVTVMWQVVFLGGLIVLFQLGYGVLGVLVAAGFANVVAFIILALGWSGRLAPTGEQETPDFQLGRILRYGLPFAAIQVFYTIVWRHSETILITRFWGATEAGYFGTAYAFTQQVLDFVPTAIWPLVMASYAAVFTLDRERARRLVEHYYKLLFLVAAPLSIGGAVLGDRALIVLYGADYAPGGGLAQIFFVVQCLSFLGTPLSMTLYVLEKTWVNLLIWVGAAIVNVGLNFILIPIDWRLGATLPVSLAVGLMPIAYWIILDRRGFRVRVPWSFLTRAYVGSAALLALIPLRNWVDGIWRLLAVAVLALVLVGVGMRLVRVFRRDDERLLAFIPSAAVRRGAAWFGEVRS